jgi:ubiquinone/menaquinone biosynthesis C-methylase UbiE
MTAQRTFVPAAGHDRWLSLYDPLTRLLGAPASLRALIAQADLQPGMRVLDIGCGTGTLAVMLKIKNPHVDVVGLDPDAKALERATRKAEHAGAQVVFQRGFADAIPNDDAAFDRVFSSFMLHHLTRDEKRAALTDVARVLKPGGTLHVLDFVSAHDRPRGVIARMLHADDHLTDTGEGRTVALLGDVGFRGAAEVGARRTLFGPVSFYRAVRGPVIHAQK